MPLFIDVFYYFLLLWLHPSIISSSVTLTAELLLLLISPRTLLPPLLSVCLQCLKDGVSGSWPLIPAGLQLTCMTAQLHAQYAGNWKWLALYIWKGSPTDTRPITIYQKHIEAKTLSTCVNLQNVDIIIVESEGCLSFPPPVPSLDLFTSLPRALCWSVLQFTSSKRLQKRGL